MDLIRPIKHPDLDGKPKAKTPHLICQLDQLPVFLLQHFYKSIIFSIES